MTRRPSTVLGMLLGLSIAIAAEGAPPGHQPNGFCQRVVGAAEERASPAGRRDRLPRRRRPRTGHREHLHPLFAKLGLGKVCARNMSPVRPRPPGAEYTVPVRVRYLVVPSSRIMRISSNGGS